MAARSAGATATVDDFIARLPADRRDAFVRVRAIINEHLPAGYEEGVLYGMPAWYVPLARFPATYNKQPLMLCGLASPKSHMALHLPSVYTDPALATWFAEAYRKSGKKLDMGKGCLRFKALDALPLDVVGALIARVTVEKYLAAYAASMAARKPKPKKPAATKAKPSAARARSKR